MKLIIAGSLHIHNRDVLLAAFKKHKIKKEDIEEVVVGQEPGMAQCGRIWAIDNDIQVKRFRIAHGVDRRRSTTGVKRGQMMEYANALLFISDGLITGIDQIKDMAKATKDMKVFIYDIEKEKMLEEKKKEEK